MEQSNRLITKNKIRKIIILIIAMLLFSIFKPASMTTVGTTENELGSEVPTLTIYTYESLLDWGLDPNQTKSIVFDSFESKEGCQIEIEEFADAGAALARIIAEKNQPRADIVIGIDNIMVFEAIEADVLEPYKPQTSESIISSLVNGLDANYYVTPYDYGLIAFVYDTTRINASSYPELSQLKLEDFYNDSLAKLLVTEDPTISSTGLSFLMWTIGMYEKILDEEWTLWWKEVKEDIQVESSWGDAFNVFYEPAANRPIVVSYGTDPAYSYFFYNDTSIKATLVTENSTQYGWLQIEGLGIVKGTTEEKLAQRFIDWFTNETVQSLIAENNWMYPANSEVTLPESYQYAIDPETVTPLNDFFDSQEIADNLSLWKEEWNKVMILPSESDDSYNSTPWLSWMLIPLLVIVSPLLRQKKES